jgi:sortase B
MIYGHNMMDGSMFAGLKEYRNRDFYDAHKTILLYTPEKNFKLEVAAVLICDADDKIRQVNFSDTTAYQHYAKMLLGYAEYSEIDSNTLPENLYCFATCTDFNNSKRFVVLARVVQDGTQAVLENAGS